MDSREKSHSIPNFGSQIRHSSYCRKRANNPPKPRKKSCVSCTKAKCYCDSVFPACSRCAKRNLVCLYNHFTQGNTGAKSQAVTEATEVAQAVGVIQGLATSGSIESIDALRTPVTRTAETCSSPGELLVFDVDFPRSDICQRSHVPLDWVLYPHVTQSTQTPREASIDRNHGTNFAHFRPFHSITTMPVLRPPRAFEPRTIAYQHLSLIRRFVVCTLCGYPRDLLAGKVLPPFIHPQCLLTSSSLNSTPTLPEPLATCVGIVALWSVKNKYNNAIIWAAIRAEQERIFAQYLTYDDSTIVAALQTMCLYFILRISEHDEDVTDFDIPLIRTMVGIAIRVMDMALGYYSATLDTPMPWEAWLLAEAAQRTVFVIFIVDFLFDQSPGKTGTICQGAEHLVKMRLPCSRRLWSASTEAEWEREYVAGMQAQQQIQHQHPCFKDLLRHDSGCGSSGAALDHWMAEVDDLGTLLVSAASLADEVGFCRSPFLSV